MTTATPTIESRIVREAIAYYEAMKDRDRDASSAFGRGRAEWDRLVETIELMPITQREQLLRKVR